MTMEEIHELTSIDPWFLDQLQEIVELEDELRCIVDPLESVANPLLRKAKQFGFSDRQLAEIWGLAEMDVREWRVDRGVRATFKSVDTCAAEFEAYTPYFYSTYEDGKRDSGQARGDQANHDPGRRSQSYWARHRVRLLLLPCEFRTA